MSIGAAVPLVSGVVCARGASASGQAAAEGVTRATWNRMLVGTEFEAGHCDLRSMQT